jgi:amino acid permease
VNACPQCQSEKLISVAQHYDVEVRKLSSDPEQLSKLAPPTRKASIHGFILAVLVWILMLIPFFASDRARWRDTIAVLVATLIWIAVYLRARKQDRILQADYQRELFCESCGWRGKPLE